MAPAAERRAVEFAKCSADCAYFTHTYGQLDQPQGDGTLATIPFALWPAQVALLWQVMRARQLLILKARQLGISWLLCAYTLWLCLFHPGRLVLLFSRGQHEADELIRRVKVLYHRLPDWLRAELPQLGTDNTSELGWSNGSRVRSLPATENAGRSFTASLVIMDEFAFMQWAAKLYTAVKPTVDGGGQLIVLSTANGKSNLFADLWERTMQRLTQFVPIFLSWRMRPDRDEAWFAQVRRDAVDPQLVSQEYPATPDEAFVSTDRSRFLPSITWWDQLAAELPALGADEPLILAADGSVISDTFGVVGLSAWQSGRLAVRYLRAWEPQGSPLDFRAIDGELRDFCGSHRVLQIAYDPYQLHQMMQGMLQDGMVWTEPFSQTTDRLIADKALLDGIRDGKLAHDRHPLLRAHLDNADRKVEGDERLRIVKRKETLRIDLAVSLSMAHYRARTDFNL